MKGPQLHCTMSPGDLLLVFVGMTGVFLVAFITPGAGISAEPSSMTVIRVSPQDKKAIFPIIRPAEYKDNHLILVKLPQKMEVATVIPGCLVRGANSFQVHGISHPPKGCDVVLSNPVKEDEGVYETRDTWTNGTLIPGLRFKLIFEDHPRSGGSKTADASKMLASGGLFLAVYLLCFLP